MKRLIGACALVGALALPGVASAFHVPGATYAGTFTTGNGGTVTLESVSADGTTVNFAGTWGQAACDVTIGDPGVQMPITGHSFAFFTDGPPLVSISGSFDGPGTASGTARYNGPCDSGVQSWTAETAVAALDLLIARSTDSGGAIGDDVYNTTAAGQTRRWSAKRGQKRRFVIGLESDGTEGDTFPIKGCGPSRKYKVKYTFAGDNVTNAVKAGTFATPDMPAGDSASMALNIRPTRRARPGRTKTCKVTGGITSGPPSVFRDAVQAKLKVKRG